MRSKTQSAKKATKKEKLKIPKAKDTLIVKLLVVENEQLRARLSGLEEQNRKLKQVMYEFSATASWFNL